MTTAERVKHAHRAHLLSQEASLKNALTSLRKLRPMVRKSPTRPLVATHLVLKGATVEASALNQVANALEYLPLLKKPVYVVLHQPDDTDPMRAVRQAVGLHHDPVLAASLHPPDSTLLDFGDIVVEFAARTAVDASHLQAYKNSPLTALIDMTQPFTEPIIVTGPDGGEMVSVSGQAAQLHPKAPINQLRRAITARDLYATLRVLDKTAAAGELQALTQRYGRDELRTALTEAFELDIHAIQHAIDSTPVFAYLLTWGRGTPTYAELASDLHKELNAEEPADAELQRLLEWVSASQKQTEQSTSVRQHRLRQLYYDRFGVDLARSQHQLVRRVFQETGTVTQVLEHQLAVIKYEIDNFNGGWLTIFAGAPSLRLRNVVTPDDPAWVEIVLPYGERVRMEFNSSVGAAAAASVGLQPIGNVKVSPLNDPEVDDDAVSYTVQISPAGLRDIYNRAIHRGLKGSRKVGYNSVMFVEDILLEGAGQSLELGVAPHGGLLAEAILGLREPAPNETVTDPLATTEATTDTETHWEGFNQVFTEDDEGEPEQQAARFDRS